MVVELFIFALSDMLLPGNCCAVGDMKQQKVRAGLKLVEIQIPTELKSGSEEEVPRMCEFTYL